MSTSAATFVLSAHSVFGPSCRCHRSGWNTHGDVHGPVPREFTGAPKGWMFRALHAEVVAQNHHQSVESGSRRPFLRMSDRVRGRTCGTLPSVSGWSTSANLCTFQVQSSDDQWRSLKCPEIKQHYNLWSHFFSNTNLQIARAVTKSLKV